LRLKLATGLRIQELVTFPALAIRHPDPNVDKISFNISPLVGCQTKYSKKRTIEIPFDLMRELSEYKESEIRKKCMEKEYGYLKKQHEKARKAALALWIADRNEESDFIFNEFDYEKTKPSHEPLFYNNRGTQYSKSSFGATISNIRDGIQKTHTDWYYRLHDLRSTFDTDWLLKEATERKCVCDILLGELAALLGHESTMTTQKYIDFSRNKDAKIKFSQRKNDAMNQAMGDAN